MPASVLVTGFEPFGGREVNASWIAARSLALTEGVRVLCLPVIWGAPLETLHALCTEDCPHTILAMGEGRAGWFDIETRARNIRGDRSDNAGATCSAPIVDGGPDVVRATIDAPELRDQLAEMGHPVDISQDGGAFLCEETLYSLERLKELHHRLERVVFSHLPPAGSTSNEIGALPLCTDDAVRAFANDLLTTVLEI